MMITQRGTNVITATDNNQWTKLVTPCSRRQLGDSIRAITGRYGALQDTNDSIADRSAFIKGRKRRHRRAMSVSQQQHAMTRFHRQRSKSLLIRRRSAIASKTFNATIDADDNITDNETDLNEDIVCCNADFVGIDDEDECRRDDDDDSVDEQRKEDSSF